MLNPHAKEFTPSCQRTSSAGVGAANEFNYVAQAGWSTQPGGSYHVPSYGYGYQQSHHSGPWQPPPSGASIPNQRQRSVPRAVPGALTAVGVGAELSGGARQGSLGQELTFDDVFGPTGSSCGLSPKSSCLSPGNDQLHLQRLKSISCVRPSLRQSSLQQSIQEDDEDWVNEIEKETPVSSSTAGEAPPAGPEGSAPYDEPTEKKKTEKIGPGSFHLLAVVGQGSFGKVFQVRKKDTGQIYAMKVMRKHRIVEKDHAAYVWSERDVLTAVEHPYIVRMLYSFQTSQKLYLVLEFVNGGHLFYQLFQEGCFLEDRTRIHAAEIVSAISFLHSKGILHRDLKPENVLLDDEGHIKVTDFGLCKGNIDDASTRADSFVGTMQYMAPEIIKGEQHTKAVDWWSVGILIYEMLAGQPPFDYKLRKKDITQKDRKTLMRRITTGKILKPKFCGKVAWDLIQGLLTRDPAQRLGSEGGGDAVKNHPFFKEIDWDELEERKMVSKYKPIVPNSLSIDNFEKRFTNMPAVDSPCGTPDNPSWMIAFQGYTYTTPSLLDDVAERLRNF
ncbi:hypothetical protein BSKO_10386 [Bryopsis sp. KO-2023]|nr:hypothetical protein BSKO_10386 [Bryopsis sp. KO-2023]